MTQNGSKYLKGPQYLKKNKECYLKSPKLTQKFQIVQNSPKVPKYFNIDLFL